MLLYNYGHTYIPHLSNGSMSYFLLLLGLPESYHLLQQLPLLHTASVVDAVPLEDQLQLLHTQLADLALVGQSVYICHL